MKVLIKTDSTNGLLITGQEAPQLAIKLLKCCKTVTTDYNDNIKTTDSKIPEVRFLHDEEIAPELTQLLEENKNLRERNSALWMEKWHLEKEIDKIKNPQPAPVVGVDAL